jgi:hypothetical protein
LCCHGAESEQGSGRTIRVARYPEEFRVLEQALKLMSELGKALNEACPINLTESVALQKASTSAACLQHALQCAARMNANPLEEEGASHGIHGNHIVSSVAAYPATSAGLPQVEATLVSEFWPDTVSDNSEEFDLNGLFDDDSSQQDA